VPVNPFVPRNTGLLENNLQEIDSYLAPMRIRNGKVDIALKQVLMFLASNGAFPPEGSKAFD
jgi:hypothetical protein